MIAPACHPRIDEPVEARRQIFNHATRLPSPWTGNGRHHPQSAAGPTFMREPCTKAGLAAARRLGRTGGRPPKLTDDDIEAAKAMLANPDIGVTQIAHLLGVSPATLYRYIPAARTANTQAFENGAFLESNKSSKLE